MPSSQDMVFEKNYVQSFVKHYEFSPEGRYVHEYHPFLLKKTARSFDLLEEELQKKGFNLLGRCVILGYEENAVPPYYTDYKESKINDEASLKSKAGWSMKLHNRFGFMTGFLFKNIVRLPCYAHSIFEHVNADSVFLFDDRAAIFQEHAFDEALPLILSAQPCIEHAVQKGDTQRLFKWLVKFWETLYSGGFKVGNKQIAGTQDILFSVENARHLLKSNLPILKYGVGPDITYPIETFSKQEREATRNAQAFVKSFVKKLEPLNDESTVYIFCSFVDGVGKSTMLGNIKNWMKYGDDVESFQHVDNSSSQLAEMFMFKDNVFIADLPAQLSHFTYKPDGLVFVDVQTEFSDEHVEELRSVVRLYSEGLEQHYESMILDVKDIIKKHGFFDESIVNPDFPTYMFLRNVLLLKKEYDNVWIPFTYDGQHYLFDRTNPLAIRFLTTLGKVKSEGLKNIESEQMLFSQGIRFPLPYQFFLDDLIGKLEKNNVKNVVFVDFLSMYPRSSRENIRINYLLQQLALLDEAFDVKQSVYKDFVSGGELLHHLLDRQKVDKVLQAFKLETLVRATLCKSIVDREEGDLSGLTIASLTQLLHKKITNYSDDFMSYVHNYVADKVIQERNYFEDLYGLSKSFMNIQQFDFSKVVKFCKVLQQFFIEHVTNAHLEFLWEDPGLLLVPSSKGKSQKENAFVGTTDGTLARHCYTFSPECKDEFILAPFLRTLRASWYATISNLIFSINQSGKLVINRQIYPAPSLFVSHYDDQTIHVFQKAFEPFKEKIDPILKKKDAFFHLTKQGHYGLLGNTTYRVNWEARETNQGIYAFTCESGKKNDDDNLNVLSRYVKKYQNDHGLSFVMPASELYDKLSDSSYWKMEYKKTLKKAKKNGSINIADGFFYFEKKPGQANGKKGTTKKSSTQNSEKKKNKKRIYWGRDEQKEGVKLWIRLIATLEMIVKDPDSPIAVRFGNRKDFKAAVLFLEKVLLPKYFNITFKKNLFSEYDDIEPYPSWLYWDE